MVISQRRARNEEEPEEGVVPIRRIVFSVFIVLFIAASSIKADSNDSELPVADISDMYKQAVASPLIEAGNDINNNEISQFYENLIASYQLNNPPSTDSTSLSLASLLPDIKNIYKTASDLPLKEAGKQIQDKEIAEFYNNFISEIGVDKQ